MIALLLHLLRVLPFLVGDHRQLALENLALRHQLAVYKRTATRPRLRATDRLFFSEAVCQEHDLSPRVSRPWPPPVLQPIVTPAAERGLSSFSSRCRWRATPACA